MIPFLDLVDLVDMVEMKIHFQYFPFLTMTFFIKTGTDHQLNNLRRPRCTQSLWYTMCLYKFWQYSSLIFGMSLINNLHRIDLGLKLIVHFLSRYKHGILFAHIRDNISLLCKLSAYLYLFFLSLHSNDVYPLQYKLSLSKYFFQRPAIFRHFSFRVTVRLWT